MATLTERFVQNTVAERLNKEYYRRKPAYVNTEVYTKLKRADVLLAFMRARKRPYVVVVEAKSRTTIHQLKLKEEPSRVRWTGRLGALAFMVGLSAILGYQWYFNAMNTLLLLSVFVLGSTVISSIARKLELNFLGSISAIEQLGRYPANEKWIAVGEDTFARPEEYEVLKQQCRKNGIGLLVVTERGKMKRILIPEPRHTFNDYLSKYGKKTAILKVIEKKPDYGPTPPERAKRRRQLLNAAVLLAIVGLLGLLTYEDRYRPVVPDPFANSYGAELPRPEPVEEDNAEEVEVDMGAAAGPRKVEEQKEAAENCTALTVTQRSFIVVDAILNTSRASDRLQTLSAAGITSLKRIPTDCLNSWPAPGREALYIDTIFSDRASAAKVARKHNDLLKEKGLGAAYGKPVKVRPR